MFRIIIVVSILVWFSFPLTAQTIVQGQISNYELKPINIAVTNEDSVRTIFTDSNGKFRVDLHKFSAYEAIISWDNKSFHIFSAPPGVVDIEADNKKFNATLKVDGKYYFKTNPEKFRFVHSDSVNSFEDIVKVAPNKVRLVELWAVWCSPCLVQQKIFKQYSSNLDSLNIKQLYISYDEVVNPGSRATWNRCIQVNNLKGYHLLANQKLYDDLTKVRGYASIPQYFIIDTLNQIYPYKFSQKLDDEPLVDFFERNLSALFKFVKGFSR
jgi:thiol-disulfide isomerase/thioredoxin